MPQIPKELTQNFFPGLGDQHVVGAAGLGVSVVNTTVEAGTVKTNAQIVAAPPNTSAGNISYGPFVHSLGTPPSFAFAQSMATDNTLGQLLSVSYVTADNSAVYFSIRHNSTVGGISVPATVRIVAVR